MGLFVLETLLEAFDKEAFQAFASVVVFKLVVGDFSVVLGHI